MQTLSMRKMSLLGLVLLAASAVTAAVMPKDKTDKQTTPGYSLSESTGGCGDQLTCSSTDNPGSPACTYTGDSTLNSTNGNGTSFTTNGINKTATGHTPNSLASTITGENTSASPC